MLGSSALWSCGPSTTLAAPRTLSRTCKTSGEFKRCVSILFVYWNIYKETEVHFFGCVLFLIKNFYFQIGIIFVALAPPRHNYQAWKPTVHHNKMLLSRLRRAHICSPPALKGGLICSSPRLRGPSSATPSRYAKRR